MSRVAAIYWATFLLYILFVIVFYAFRDFGVGADTANYAAYFERVASGVYQSRYEPLFSLVTIVVAVFFDSYYFYFGVLFIFFAFFYFYAAGSFSAFSFLRADEGLLFALLMIAICTFSSWYFTAATNALRHGISLSLLYVSLMFLLRGKSIGALLFFLLSLGFHYSVILLLPFLGLLLVSGRIFLFVFGIIAVGYPLGLNEKAVALISSLFGLDVYARLADYASEDALWVGFQWDFYLYSLFWLAFSFVVRHFVFARYKFEYDRLVKIYMVLLFPYMAFGFGGFSNRYAFMAWLFLPILQSYSVLMIAASAWWKLLLVLLLIAVGMVVHMGRFGFLSF
ncbi:EpsG family protein [Stutzerimonas stutzeri]|uniref:EpsG family protein n=1 Tax=Stutzerimonas stutzeri TaxID=316 RepID=UPI001C745E53|nr:EpsG family protein [Stutzerimonas stutzeri]BCY01820.1 hypothetical protein PszF2a_16090 [Stutzerimonas stutzeri]